MGLSGDDRARRGLRFARDEGDGEASDGGDWVLNGTKHFISHADIADFAICFMATGVEDTPRGPKKKITAFLCRQGHARFLRCVTAIGNVSHRGYTNAVLEFDEVPPAGSSAVLGEVDKGFRGGERPGWARRGFRWPRPVWVAQSGRFAAFGGLCGGAQAIWSADR